ncbi:hypothetical protein CPC08DRAFT_702065 [Agrocybe pediades]|nr:hypothetical protein CPC08DRAFT_702065 [Agrocybe pediades]
MTFFCHWWWHLIFMLFVPWFLFSASSCFTIYFLFTTPNYFPHASYSMAGSIF